MVLGLIVHFFAYHTLVIITKFLENPIADSIIVQNWLIPGLSSSLWLWFHGPGCHWCRLGGWLCVTVSQYYDAPFAVSWWWRVVIVAMKSGIYQPHPDSSRPYQASLTEPKRVWLPIEKQHTHHWNFIVSTKGRVRWGNTRNMTGQPDKKLQYLSPKLHSKLQNWIFIPQNHYIFSALTPNINIFNPLSSNFESHNPNLSPKPKGLNAKALIRVLDLKKLISSLRILAKTPKQKATTPK